MITVSQSVNLEHNMDMTQTMWICVGFYSNGWEIIYSSYNRNNSSKLETVQQQNMAWRAFLKSPETFWVDFEHNYPCILQTMKFLGMKLCYKLNNSYLKDTLK